MARLSADVYRFAADGGFGKEVEPPLLWDPALDDVVYPLLQGGNGHPGLAARHLATGQGILVGADRLWPAAGLREKALHSGAGEIDGLFIQDMDGGPWMTSARRMLEFMERASRPEVALPAGVRRLLAERPPEGSFFFGVPAPSLVAYLGASEGDGLNEAAIVRAGDGEYVVAATGQVGDSRDPRQGGAAIDDYFHRCTWGAQAEGADCGLGSPR